MGWDVDEDGDDDSAVVGDENVDEDVDWHFDEHEEDEFESFELLQHDPVSWK